MFGFEIDNIRRDELISICKRVIFEESQVSSIRKQIYSIQNKIDELETRKKQIDELETRIDKIRGYSNFNVVLRYLLKILDIYDGKCDEEYSRILLSDELRSVQYEFNKDSSIFELNIIQLCAVYQYMYKWIRNNMDTFFKFGINEKSMRTDFEDNSFQNKYLIVMGINEQLHLITNHLYMNKYK